MNRPKIICHILQSVDGNIDGGFFAAPGLAPAFQAFARIRAEYACDAVISGATTAAEIYGGGRVGDLPETKVRFPRTTWQAKKTERYAVIIDGEGTVRWERGDIERRGEKLHAVVVLQENVRDAYIDHLRRAGVSYLFAGKDALDLPLAARQLKEQFGIGSMLLSGGGIVDWSFLQAGLIDEISLVIPPVVDGGLNVASAFDDSPFAPAHAPVALALKDVQRLDGDVLWLKYVPE